MWCQSLTKQSITLRTYLEINKNEKQTPNYRNESNMILVYLQSKTKRKFWLLVKIEMRFFCRHTDSYILESQTVSS